MTLSVNDFITKLQKWILASRDNIKKEKGQPIQEEKIFVDCVSGKGLVPRSVQCSNKQTNDPIKNWTEDLNGHFSKEDIQMSKKHENMLNIIGHQENPNHNQIEIPLHTYSDDYNKKYR